MSGGLQREVQFFTLLEELPSSRDCSQICIAIVCVGWLRKRDSQSWVVSKLLYVQCRYLYLRPYTYPNLRKILPRWLGSSILGSLALSNFGSSFAGLGIKKMIRTHSKINWEFYLGWGCNWTSAKCHVFGVRVHWFVGLKIFVLSDISEYWDNFSPISSLQFTALDFFVSNEL